MPLAPDPVSDTAVEPLDASFLALPDSSAGRSQECQTDEYIFDGRRKQAGWASSLWAGATTFKSVEPTGWPPRCLHGAALAPAHTPPRRSLNDAAAAWHRCSPALSLLAHKPAQTGRPPSDAGGTAAAAPLSIREAAPGPAPAAASPGCAGTLRRRSGCTSRRPPSWRCPRRRGCWGSIGRRP